MGDSVKNSGAPAAVDEVLSKERNYLGLKSSPELGSGDRGAKRHGDVPHALCLSGGGIRSATFCLGALQGLAQRGLLSRFHYLSTVSGGGYIGGWLSRWIRDAGGNVAAVEGQLARPDGSTPAAACEGKSPIQNLRAYSNYLSPVWGLSIDTFSLIAIFLRNLLLNWAVLLPLLAALVLLPRLYAAMGAGALSLSECAKYLLVVAALLATWGMTYAVMSESRVKSDCSTPDKLFFRFCLLPLLASALLFDLALRSQATLPTWATEWIIAGSFGVHLVAYVLGRHWRSNGGINQPTRRVPGQPFRLWNYVSRAIPMLVRGVCFGLLVLVWLRFAATEALNGGSLHGPLGLLLGVPAVVICFALATTVYVAVAKALFKDGEFQREWWARASGWGLRFVLGWIAAFGITLYAPSWIAEFGTIHGEALTAGGGLLGVVTALGGYWVRNSAKIVARSQRFAARLGMRVLDLAAIAFIIAVLAGASLLADRVFSSDGTAPTEIAHRPSPLLLPPKIDEAARETDAVAKAIVEMAGSMDSTSRKDAREAMADWAKHVRELTRRLDSDQHSGEVLLILEKTHAAIAKADDALHKAESKPPLGIESRPAFSDMKGGLADTAAKWMALNRTVSGGDKGGQAYQRRFVASNLKTVSSLLATLLLVAVLFSMFIGANTYSLHHMYGNRLVRAYLGAARKTRQPHPFTGFDPDDNIALRDLVPTDAKRPARLFHVVNTTLNMVSPTGNRLEWQQRKAASFSFTPFHAGSSETGYRDSGDYFGKPLSLGRAMTISGAAASPNMGYHSSAPVAFAMTFFNLRLGWWLRNPKDIQSLDQTHPVLAEANALRLKTKESIGLTSAESTFIYLSDGGHFDNLGLYEMIRRGCLRIVVIDASADPSYEYGDLQDTLRKIRIDFGVAIEFPPGMPSRQLRCAIARIRYRAAGAGDKDGWLFYLKPTLLGDESLDVRRYAEVSKGGNAQNPFPHQSTADQFFDEAQFESYRMLGQHTVQTAFGGEGVMHLRSYMRSRPAPSDGKDDKHPGEPGESVKNIIEAVSGGSGAIPKAALLASAITVGGVVGVSGTVALSNPTVALRPDTEIGIRKESLDFLGDIKVPVNLTVDGKFQTPPCAPETKTPSDCPTDPGMEKFRNRIDELAAQLRNLSQELLEQAEKIRLMSDNVNAVEKRTAGLELRDERFAGQIKALETEHQQLATSNNVSAQLSGINSTLQKMNGIRGDK